MRSILYSNFNTFPQLPSQITLTNLLTQGNLDLYYYYLKEITAYTGLLRVPSTTLHKLAQNNEHNIEDLIQVAVRQGRLAIGKKQADCLLVGCLTFQDGFSFSQKELAQNYAQQVIFLIDNGVDCLFIQASRSVPSLLAFLQVIIQVNHVPVPIVVSLEKLPNMIDQETVDLLSRFNVEGICFALSLEELLTSSQESLTFPFEELATGFLLSSKKTKLIEAEQKNIASKLMAIDMLFSSNEINFQIWNQLQKILSL